MPAHNVRFPTPLTRLNPWFPGQMGVPGTDTETGLRMHSTGAVFYVDPNYPGVSDARDGTSPTDPLQTVATALTKCQAYRGDVIAVMGNNAWQYSDGVGFTTPIAEEVEVTVPGVKIVGVSASSVTNVIWTPASNGGTCITVSACDVLIEGFHFWEGGTYTGLNGIYAAYDGTTLFGDSLTVRNCVFDDTVDIAIQTEFSWYCDIYNNWFTDCAVWGIYTDPTGSFMDFSKIHDNWFHDVGVGGAGVGGGAIYIPGSSNNVIYGNYIYNGLCEAAAAAPNELIATNIGAAVGTDNLITGNFLSCQNTNAANGDFGNGCTFGGTDASVQNFCMNGPTTIQV